MDTRKVLLEYVTSPIRLFELSAQMPFCSRFFEPLPKFITWCKETYPDAQWVDMGAGQGHVTQALRKAGLDALAIDLFLAESDAVIDDISKMDAAMFPFFAGHIGLICRPCRGEWIHASIIKAVEADCPVVYVGKDSHFDEDLQPLPYNTTLIMTDAGEAGESVWLVTK